MTRLSFVLRREWLSLIFGGVLVMLILSALLGNLGPRDLVALQSHRAALEARRHHRPPSPPPPPPRPTPGAPAPPPAATNWRQTTRCSERAFRSFVQMTA